MTTLTSYMKKQQTTKKSEKNQDMSLNHSKSVRFRIRVQQDKEHLKVLKEFYDQGDITLPDVDRRQE